MLHTNADLHNQSKLVENFNNSRINLTHSLNLYSNLKHPTSIDKNHIECCLNIDDIETKSNVTLPNEGAKLVIDDEVNELEVRKNRKRRVVNVIRTDVEVTTSDTRRYIEGTTLSLLSSQTPMVMERRRKPGETGSSAPLLNYIFDTIHSSNTHQHRNEK